MNCHAIQNNKNTCGPSEISDQLSYRVILIRFYTVNLIWYWYDREYQGCGVVLSLLIL